MVSNDKISNLIWDQVFEQVFHALSVSMTEGTLGYRLNNQIMRKLEDRTDERVNQVWHRILDYGFKNE